jgi:hypothetical protein
MDHTESAIGMETTVGYLQLLEADRYRVESIVEPSQHEEYGALLRKVYEPLGFMHENFQPTAESRCYRIQFQEQTAAVFRLAEVTDKGSPYFRLVPGATQPDGTRSRLLEVNNVVVARKYRGTPALGIILRYSARIAAAEHYRAVVGTTRYQTLRYFADFGVLPVAHEPLHLLGRDDLLDFVIYYDTIDPISCLYMEERSNRFFRQQLILKEIQAKYASRLPTISCRTERSNASETA